MESSLLTALKSRAKDSRTIGPGAGDWKLSETDAGHDTQVHS